MIKRLLVAALIGSSVTAVYAQSAFEGFYGQIATGYEGNSVSNLNTSIVDVPATPGNTTNFNAANQNFGTAPLIVGLGYTFSVAPKWTVGLGADYSTISQTSSTYSGTFQGGDINGANGNGMTLKISNRFNIFLTPGYEIDKDKLVYLKAGYSSVSLQQNSPTSLSGGGVSVPVSLSNASNTLSGYVLGLGYKQIITGGFYGYAEGNYMSYSKASYTTTTRWTDGTGYSNFNTNPSLSSYQLLVGVGYKF